MNQDQITSLIRSVLKFVGGLLVAHGATKAATLLNMNLETLIGLATTITGFILSHQWHKTPSSPPSGGISIGLLLAILLPVSLFTQGCNILGSSGQLAAGGAYAPANFVVATNSLGVVVTNSVALSAPDPAFFAVDASFDLAASTVDAALKFERDNRPLLWKISPSIKHQLDAIRPEAWNAIGLYTQARAGYIANPTPDGLTTLQTWMSKLQALAAAAQSANGAATNTVAKP